MSSNRVDFGANPLNVNRAAANAERGGAQTVITVRLPDATPSRDEIARAVFASFGFGPQDDSFLRQRFGVDPVRHFADTLRFDPRSVSRAPDGATTIRVSLGGEDLRRLQTLAAERQQQPPSLFSPTLPLADTWATRNLYDPTQALRSQLNVEPLPVQTTTTTTPATRPAANNEEGVGVFFEGAVAGDFSENQSWSRVGGQVVVGVIPIVGQIADARDTAAALRDVWEGREGGWANLGAAAVGWIPLFGDAAKGAFRVGRKVVNEGGEQIAERAVRETVTSAPPSVTSLAPPPITPSVSTVTDAATAPLQPRQYGVFFFGDDVLPYVDRADATLGRNGRQHFFMPLEDAAGITDAGQAARQSGHAPSILNAYVNGTPAYGVSFPTNGLTMRAPTADDAGGWAHFLEGGRTAVRTADPNGGYLLNPTREFVTPGGNTMPQGSVLFRIDEGGAWTPVRRFP